MPLLSERYPGEHDDLRFEYQRDEVEAEIERLEQEAGCTEHCPPDCDSVQDMLEGRQARRDLDHDFYSSRGVF